MTKTFLLMAETFFNQLVKIAIGQGDYYITGCSLAYPQFKENYWLIEMDISKQQVLESDLKVI